MYLIGYDGPIETSSEIRRAIKFSSTEIAQSVLDLIQKSGSLPNFIVEHISS